MSTSHLKVGYVAKAHGLRGEVTIKTFDPASTALLEVERAFVQRKDGTGEELAIESARTSSKDVLLTFEAISGREAAEALVGSTVFVFREDLEPPEEGEYFMGDLIGLEAFTEDGQPVGKVEEVHSLGEVPNLVIRMGEEELMLPFVEAFVPVVDLAHRRLTVRRPEYFE